MTIDDHGLGYPYEDGSGPVTNTDMKDIPNASMRRIFLVGCPRSGTTVVQAVLASLPGVMSFGETNYLLRLLGQFDRWLRGDPVTERKWRKRLRLAKRKTHRVMQHSIESAFERAEDVPRLRRHWSGRAYLREFCRALDLASQAQGCHCWVEKTPDHLAYVDVLAREIPDAHFLHVVRNGEDVLASAIDGQMRYRKHEVFEGGIPHWVERWNRAVGVHVQHAQDARHTVLPFECLFAAPDEVHRLLCNLAGIDEKLVPRQSGNRLHIADLDEEPWKRGSTEGIPRLPKRKFERVFGPDTQLWIRAHLADYRQVINALALAQPELPWIARAMDVVTLPKATAGGS